MSKAEQVLEALNLGIVILDRELRVEHWNRWMAVHSGLPAERVVGRRLFDLYPELDEPILNRDVRSVLAFGNFAFFSQKLHAFLFPFRSPATREEMQQSCIMGPVRGEDGAIVGVFLSVEDVTERVAQQRKLAQMNMRDALTGVFNRRYLDHRLDLELERFRRYGRPLAILLLDIDHFKQVNDRLGHACGDAVLCAVAGTLERELRKADVVARYGGEEFCCVLPETELSGAMVAAEKLRAAVEACEARWGGQLVRVTISIGVAEVASAVPAAPSALLELADGALYAAKRGGRNRVIAAREPGPAAANS